MLKTPTNTTPPLPLLLAISQGKMFDYHLVDETSTGVMVPRAGEALPHPQQLGRPVPLHLSAVRYGVIMLCWPILMQSLRSNAIGYYYSIVSHLDSAKEKGPIYSSSLKRPTSDIRRRHARTHARTQVDDIANLGSGIFLIMTTAET